MIQTVSPPGAPSLANMTSREPSSSGSPGATVQPRPPFHRPSGIGERPHPVIQPRPVAPTPVHDRAGDPKVQNATGVCSRTSSTNPRSWKASVIRSPKTPSPSFSPADLATNGTTPCTTRRPDFGARRLSRASDRIRGVQIAPTRGSESTNARPRHDIQCGPRLSADRTHARTQRCALRDRDHLSRTRLRR